MNSAIFFVSADEMYGSLRILFMYAFTIADSFPYFSSNIAFAQLYPSGINGRDSTSRFTLSPRSSRRYENFAMLARPDFSIDSVY
jgi:hypothetical protein